MTRLFLYSRHAEADLREIIRHTSRKWGATRARVYARQIDAAATDLAKGQGPFKDWNMVHPGLRVKPAGSHYLFGVRYPDRPALILAILHKRMDLIARLRERLND